MGFLPGPVLSIQPVLIPAYAFGGAPKGSDGLAELPGPGILPGRSRTFSDLRETAELTDLYGFLNRKKLTECDFNGNITYACESEDAVVAELAYAHDSGSCPH